LKKRRRSTERLVAKVKKTIKGADTRNKTNKEKEYKWGEEGEETIMDCGRGGREHCLPPSRKTRHQESSIPKNIENDETGRGKKKGLKTQKEE